jgi:hypothetical protein
VALTPALEPRQLKALSHMGDVEYGRHVFATGGFLDTWLFNRTFWGYWARWPGFYLANQAPKSGQILVHNDKSTWAVKYFAKREGLSAQFRPGGPGCLVTADPNENEPLLYNGKSEIKPIKWLPWEHRKRGRYDNRAEDVNKGTGYTRSRRPTWMEWHDVRVTGLVLAADRLYLAGAPDEVDPADPMAGFEGRAGAVLRTVHAADGTPVGEMRLNAPPVFDGLIAAEGRLFMSSVDGSVVCVSSE